MDACSSEQVSGKVGGIVMTWLRFKQVEPVEAIVFGPQNSR